MPRPARGALKKQIQTVGTTLRRLERQLRALVPALAQATQASVARALAAARTGAAPRPRRKIHLTPERRRFLKQQGRYLGYMRQLGPAAKARVKVLKAKKGYPAAIRMAKDLASKR